MHDDKRLDGDGDGAGVGGGGPGTEVVVVKVDNHVGATTMRDLTVATIHTYYVIAGDTPVLVHNCNGATIELKYKADWTPAQRAAADAKVAALNHQAQNGGLFVTDAAAARGSTSAADLYRQAGREIPPNSDIDHRIDLQLGGPDNIGNLWPLDTSVNRSLGPQIDRQIKKLGLQIGDQVCSVVIRDRC